MIVSTSDRRIKKLRIFSEKPRHLIAEALPSNYQAYPAGSPARASSETTYVPPAEAEARLETRTTRALDVALTAKVKLNQFDHARSAEMFVEPEMPGYKRQNLADLSRGSRPEGRTTTRETIPPPDARNGVRLGRPAPMKDDEPVVPSLGRGELDRRRNPTRSPLPTLDAGRVRRRRGPPSSGRPRPRCSHRRPPRA